MSLDIKNGFAGKSVFFTGVTGFVGKVLLYKLLNEFGDVINKIYVLIRTRKGVAPRERFVSQVCTSQCFEPLAKKLGSKESLLEFMHSKVVPLSGDILEERLGLSSEDYQIVVDKANYVIHVAATVNFTELLDRAVCLNVFGTLRVFTLARKCKNLDAMIHTSTCYVNWARDSDKVPVMEKIYSVNFDPEEVVKHIMALHSEHIKEESAKMLEFYNFPNTYTFTKNIAEQLLQKYKGDMPLAIVRPAIIGCAWKDPCPGWVDVLTAAGAIIMTAGMGFMHELHGQPDYIADMVPVDYVVNILIKAAFQTAQHRKGRLQVCNKTLTKQPEITIISEERSKKSDGDAEIASTAKATSQSTDIQKQSEQNEFPWIFAVNTSGTRNKIRWRMFFTPIKSLWMRGITHPHTMDEPDLVLLPYQIQWQLRFLLRRKLPYYIYKSFTWLPYLNTSENKKRLQMYAKGISKLEYLNLLFMPFTTKQWIFDNSNSMRLDEHLSLIDLEHFGTDAYAIQWYTYCQLYSWGMCKFILKEKKIDVLEPMLPMSSTKVFMEAML